MVMADEVQDLPLAERPELPVMDVLETHDYKCSQCFTMFDDQRALFKHVHLQHQQHVHYRRKYRCDRCERTFKSMTGLRNHARTHPGYFDTTLDASIASQPSVEETVDDNDILIKQSPTITSTSKINFNETICSNNVNKRGFVTKNVELSADDIEHSESINKQIEVGSDVVTSSEKHDNHPHMISSAANTRKSERRKSGIPRPIRRSLYAENDADSVKCENHDAKLLKTSSNVLTNSTYLSPKSNSRGVLTPTKSSINLKVENERKHTPKQRKFTPKQKTPLTPKSAGKKPKPNSKNTPSKARITPKRLTPRNIISGLPDSAKIYKMDGDMFMCKKCGKSFVDRSKLNVHFTVHSKETPEKCGISKRMVRRNIASQISADSPFESQPTQTSHKSLHCHKCDQKFDSEELLRIHSKSHATKIYPCSYCEKKFRFQSSLRAHSFVHQGETTEHVIDIANNDVTSEKDNKTMECSSADLQLNIFSLFSEVNSPTIYFPFKCRSCDFSTGLPAELLSHMKTHSRQGPYTCKQCQRSYKQQSNLDVHEKIHTISKIKTMINNNGRIKQRR